jgi:hypothetical protein
MALMQKILHSMLITCMQSIDNIFVAWRPDVSTLGILVGRTLPYTATMYPTGAMRPERVDGLYESNMLFAAQFLVEHKHCPATQPCTSKVRCPGSTVCTKVTTSNYAPSRCGHTVNT